MELLDTLIDKMGYTRSMHGIAAAKFFRWHGDNQAVDELEEEYMS